MSEILMDVEMPGIGSVVAGRYLPDDHLAYVIPSLLGQGQLCIGDPVTCEHRYTYASVMDAVIAFLVWDPEGDEEPTGWHRHQPSNRRRPNGNPAEEYVRE